MVKPPLPSGVTVVALALISFGVERQGDDLGGRRGAQLDVADADALAAALTDVEAEGLVGAVPVTDLELHEGLEGAGPVRGGGEVFPAALALRADGEAVKDLQVVEPRAGEVIKADHVHLVGVVGAGHERFHGDPGVGAGGGDVVGAGGGLVDVHLAGGGQVEGEVEGLGGDGAGQSPGGG